MSGDLRKVSQSTVSITVRKVSSLLAQNVQRFIKFPENENTQRENIAKFYRIARFPSVAGLIDCTHIPIVSQGGPNGEVFRNRKRYFSLNVQVLFKFLNVFSMQ